MLSNYVSPGFRVDISPIERKMNDVNEMERKVYKSQVCEILSDDRLEITMPMEKGRLILLPIDKEFDVHFYTERGLYQCFARIIDRFKRNNLYILSLELTSNLRKHQRREYYRFSCSLELDTRKLVKEEIESLKEEKVSFLSGLPLKKGIIADISGGGLRFLASEQYEQGSLVMCKWHLVVEGQLKEYNLIGKILYSQELDARNGEYEHRLQYLNVDKMEQEEIIRFIFEEERKSRKRETGI
jgi:c-di-GMP-binding flagellar brake protein YcgR